MIESMTFTRGSSNIGWTVDGLNHNIDVSFTVVSLDSIMHMPVMDRFWTWWYFLSV